MDCIGTQAIFSNCPAYLAPDGIFVNIGAYEGALRTILNALFNMFLPTWLGGVPRSYKHFSAKLEKRHGVELMDVLKEGHVKFVVDEVIPFEDALRVCMSFSWER